MKTLILKDSFTSSFLSLFRVVDWLQFGNEKSVATKSKLTVISSALFVRTTFLITQTFGQDLTKIPMHVFQNKCHLPFQIFFDLTCVHFLRKTRSTLSELVQNGPYGWNKIISGVSVMTRDGNNVFDRIARSIGCSTELLSCNSKNRSSHFAAHDHARGVREPSPNIIKITYKSVSCFSFFRR
jgi:hypothetical protein